mmetsp:Transcript_8847/g.26520  ORF Transcript_8847/g.26520 Transcript_8847/m.26520 type:complete len:267 (-) Transcript_8847:3350-4150(-)
MPLVGGILGSQQSGGIGLAARQLPLEICFHIRPNLNQGASLSLQGGFLLPGRQRVDLRVQLLQRRAQFTHYVVRLAVSLAVGLAAASLTVGLLELILQGGALQYFGVLLYGRLHLTGNGVFGVIQVLFVAFPHAVLGLSITIIVCIQLVLAPFLLAVNGFQIDQSRFVRLILGAVALAMRSSLIIVCIVIQLILAVFAFAVLDVHVHVSIVKLVQLLLATFDLAVGYLVATLAARLGSRGVFGKVFVSCHNIVLAIGFATRLRAGL